MRHALSAAELALLRTRPQATRFFLAVHKPRTIMLASLSDVNAYPGSAIVVNAPASGALTDVQAGMTMRVGTEIGASNLGIIRVRKAPSGSTVFVAEYGSGLIDWRTNACITVVEEFRPWAIHHRWNDTGSAWNVDFDPYNDQLSNYGPVALMGPPFVGWIESTGKVAACYLGDRSYSMTAGASITSQSWSFPNGQTVTSALGSSQTPIRITYLDASPNGRYTSLTVTDGNGSSHIGRRLTFVFNTSNASAPAVSFDQISGGLREGGYRTRLYVHRGGGSENFVDGAEVVIFEKASYGTSVSSVGGNFPFRQNIVMRGWIVGNSVRIEPFSGEVSFAVETIDGVLAKTDTYDLFLENYTAASSWDTACGLTLDRAAVALTKYRSTIANITDMNFCSGLAATTEILFQALPKGNLWAQLQANYGERGILGLVAADLQSSIYASDDIQVSGLSATRPAVEIRKDDRRDALQAEHESFDTISEYRVYAVSGTSPIAAVSPGTLAGYFGGRREITRGLLVDNQDTLITWAGNLRARENNAYKRVVVPFAGNYRLDPVPQHRMTMSLSPTDVGNIRGINWENQVFIPYELRIDYDARTGAVTTETVAEQRVNGIGGSALDLPPVIIDPVDPPIPGDTGSGGTVLVVTSSKVGYTTSFLAGSPTWRDKTGSISGTIVDFILDPYDPANKAYCLTTATVYKTTNLGSSTPTWTSVYTAASANSTLGTSDATFRRIHATITAEGYLWVNISTTTHSVGSGWATFVARSTNAGTSWSIGTVLTDMNSTQENTFFGLDVSDHSASILYCHPTDNYSYGTMRSTDGGATWSNRGGYFGAFTKGADLFLPYPSNDNDLRVYVMAWGSSFNKFYRSVDGGANYEDITPSGFTFTNGSADTNPYMINVATATGVDIMITDGTRLFRSRDGGSSWTQVSTMGAGTARALGRWPYDPDRVFILTATQILYSTDGGSNFSEKMGNWSTVMGGGFANGVMIVPIWVL